MLFDFEGLINLTFLLYQKKKTKNKKMARTAQSAKKVAFKDLNKEKVLKIRKSMTLDDLKEDDNG